MWLWWTVGIGIVLALIVGFLAGRWTGIGPASQPVGSLRECGGDPMLSEGAEDRYVARYQPRPQTIREKAALDRAIMRPKPRRPDPSEPFRLS